MSMHKKTKKEFDEKINEVSRETHWGDAQDSPIHDFGYKTQRDDELFTITDFSNIKKFIESHFTDNRVLEEKMKEELQDWGSNHRRAVQIAFRSLKQSLLDNK